MKSLKKAISQTMRWIEREFAFPFIKVTLIDAPPTTVPPARLIGNRIEVNRSFVTAMEKSGVPADKLVRLLVARETNALTAIPGGTYQLLDLYSHLRAAVYSEAAASRFLYAYLDLWNDIDLAQNHGLQDDLRIVYEISIQRCTPSPEDLLYQVIAGLFGYRAKIALPLRLTPVYTELVRTLSELDFLEPKSRSEEIYRFGKALSAVFSFRAGKRAAAPSGTPAEPLPRWPLGLGLNDRDLGEQSDIETAIAEFSASLSDELADLLLEALSRLGASGIAAAGFQDGRWWFYRQKARGFAVPVEPKAAIATPPPIPLDLTDWAPDDRPESINPFASMGRAALPGITQRWRIQGVDSSFRVLVIPDLLILIDTSGSMPNPRLLLSFPVLAGVVMALTYLQLGSAVAVYNFSDADLVLDFSTEEPAVLRTIAAYKCGGVERIDTAIVERLLSSRQKAGREVDVVLISDMSMSKDEKSRVADIVRGHKAVNRIFFLVKGAKAAEVRNSFGGDVTVFPVDSEVDVASLAISVSSTLEGRNNE